mmetsp:Transcript_8260/g.16328  ORF Transcript_8260/g.16328 Transcript_8260/m.16328 type:complete len:98 (+) Transcript_8260:1273-1566(+)
MKWLLFRIQQPHLPNQVSNERTCQSSHILLLQPLQIQPLEVFLPPSQPNLLSFSPQHGCLLAAPSRRFGMLASTARTCRARLSRTGTAPPRRAARDP